MENENNESTNSETGDNSSQEAPDATALKERNEKLESDNKQLFERAKKAEGFEKDGGGNWIKVEKKEPKETKTVKKETESKKSDEEFGLLELTFLKGEDVKGEEEVQFVKEQLEEAGLTTDKLPKLFANKYFQAQLEEFRTDKANVKATSGVEGGGGESKAVNTPEYWIAKGLPPTPEQVPDRKTRAKIAREMMKNASTSGKKFYNE